jgi:hypothetical protein
VADKIKILFTLAILKEMIKPSLQEVYKSVYPDRQLDPKLSKQVLLDSILEVAEPLPPVQKLQTGEFEYDGKKYKSILPAIEIPGIGIRTALEIAADEEAQAYLIKQGCVGTVIKEID